MLGTVVLHTRLAERQVRDRPARGGRRPRPASASTSCASSAPSCARRRAWPSRPQQPRDDAGAAHRVPAPSTRRPSPQVLASVGHRRRGHRRDHRRATRSTRSAASRRRTERRLMDASSAGGRPRGEQRRRGAPTTARQTTRPPGCRPRRSTHRPVELPPRVGAPVGRRADPPRQRRPAGTCASAADDVMPSAPRRPPTVAGDAERSRRRPGAARRGQPTGAASDRAAGRRGRRRGRRPAAAPSADRARRHRPAAAPDPRRAPAAWLAELTASPPVSPAGASSPRSS